MSNTPIYSAQGGGRLYWRVTSATSDYSDQLASITGLSKRVDYNGGLYFGEATIQLAGWGLLNGDGIGTAINIAMTDASGNILAGWGDYVITATEKTGQSVKIAAKPIKATQIPEDYNWYEFRPWQPRKFAQNWLNAAMQSQDTVAFLPAATAERAEARLVAPASTLKGLAGLRPPAGQTTCETKMQLGTVSDSTTWADPVHTTQAPPAYDLEMDFAPKIGTLLGTNPLYWHAKGGYFEVRGYFRDTNTGQTPSNKCQFPLGIVQYMYCRLYWYGSNNIYMYSFPTQSVPNETKDITLEFQTRKEAKQYLAENAAQRPPATPMSPFGKSTRLGVTADGSRMYRGYKKGGRTVEIRNVAVYNGTAAKWYDSARAALASSATKPASVADGEETLWEGVIFSTSASIAFPNPNLFVGNLHFSPVELDSDWAAIGINGASTLRPGYAFFQTLYPVTIAQDYSTKEHFCEACMLGHVGFYQNATGLVGADLCQESGTVYGLPLTVHTVVAVENGARYSIPKEIWLNFRDQYAVERSYKYPDLQGWLSGGQGESMALSLSQGFICPSTPTAGLGISSYISLRADQWDKQPGAMASRLHGSDWSAAGMTVLQSNASGDLAQFLGENGEIVEQTSPNFGSFAGTIGTYAVRGDDGTEWSPFAGNMRCNFLRSDASKVAAATAPLLDIYGVNVWAKGNATVYANNRDRQSFIVQCTMAFASAEPGDVVAVQLPQIFEGAQMLAAVVASEVDSGGVCKLEIVPMHKITSTDYNNFSNLSEVLP